MEFINNFLLGILCGALAISIYHWLYVSVVMTRIKYLFAELYQILGVHDASVDVMDAVSDASEGKFTNKSLLPYTIQGGDE